MDKKLNEILVMEQQIEENMDSYSSYNLSIMELKEEFLVKSIPKIDY